MAKRRKRYKTDPIGMKYERGSLIDVVGELEKDFWRKTAYTAYPNYGRKRRRQKYYREPEVSFSDLPPWAQALVGIVILGILAWIFVINPFIEWAKQNIITIIVLSVIIVAVLITGFVFYWKHEKRKEAEKQAFEEEQKAKGLVKFVDRFGNEKWGKPSEIEKWEKEDKEAKIKESLFNQVVESIKNFEPSRKYSNEFGYHTELQGWLKSHFQNSRVELKTGASRPDIVINNDIAIEVKGPTDNQALNTLTTKCLKYSIYYTHLIIVLFEPLFSESNYSEIVEGIKQHFPNVKVIRKD